MSRDEFDIVYFTLAIGALALCVLIYLLPWVIAKRRDVHDTFLLFLVNLLLGWSGILWIVCLLWSVFGQTKAQKRFYEGGRG